MKVMRTAIILVNWHGADDTIACLESLLQVQEPHFVIIADNASEDDSVERIESWLKKNEDKGFVSEYKLLRLDANYGFAIGNPPGRENKPLQLPAPEPKSRPDPGTAQCRPKPYSAAERGYPCAGRFGLRRRQSR